MRSEPTVELPIASVDGSTAGSLSIFLLPGGHPVSLQVAPEHDPACLAPIQLLEGTEYRYTLETPPSGASVVVEPQELFHADTEDGLQGRLKVGSEVGLVAVQLLVDGAAKGSTSLEVRSKKLGYRDEYRWMLNDIAERAAELTLQRFAPAVGALEPELEGVPPRTLYQRFAFLQSLVFSERFQAAMAYIQERPHTGWERYDERRPPALGARRSPRTARQVVSARVRVQSPPGFPIRSLPREIEIERHDETTDTIPNRFVAHVLSVWRELASEVRDQAPEHAGDAARQRCLRESSAVIEQLDAWLLSEPVRTAGRLHFFPAENPVLQRRVAYRDVLRAYLLIDVVARLAWDGGDDVFSGGRKDVARLYELWCFLQLATLVENECDSVQRGLQGLVEKGQNGLNLNLASEASSCISGTASRLGRTLRIQLFLNRSFKTPGAGKPPSYDTGFSWTRGMRPDYSMRITVEDGSQLGRSGHAVWIHFDAKYRANVGFDEEDEPEITAKRADLLKMHAYRDAVPGSAGSYVLFPGDPNHRERAEKYTEILPGLGAFALRPSEGGRATGVDEIRQFITSALDHLANQASRYERATYWNRSAHSGPSTTSRAVDFLESPPADTRVTLGYVRSRDHYQWILGSGLYNMRADPGRRGRVPLGGAEIDAELVALYGPSVGEQWLFRVQKGPVITNAGELVELGYPNPGGSKYVCLPITPVVDEDLAGRDVKARLRELVSSASEQHPGRDPYAPLPCRWLDIAKAIYSGEAGSKAFARGRRR